MNWKPINTAPLGGRSPRFLVTNNLNARDAFGNMCHVWLVPMIHEEGGGFFAYQDGTMQRVYGLTHWASIPPPDKPTTPPHKAKKKGRR